MHPSGLKDRDVTALKHNLLCFSSLVCISCYFKTFIDPSVKCVILTRLPHGINFSPHLSSTTGWCVSKVSQHVITAFDSFVSLLLALSVLHLFFAPALHFPWLPSDLSLPHVSSTSQTSWRRVCTKITTATVMSPRSSSRTTLTSRRVMPPSRGRFQVKLFYNTPKTQSSGCDMWSYVIYPGVHHFYL